jgi:hypothetical protein
MMPPMTTTPTTYQGIWVESVALPTDLLADDSVISWSQVKTRPEELTEEDLTVGTDTLLDDFLALASADPEQMAAFMARYGVLELCGAHGCPIGHEDAGCPFLEIEERTSLDTPWSHFEFGGRWGVSVQHVRRAARGFADLVQWGQSARDAQKVSPRRGRDIQMLLPGIFTRATSERERIAYYLTRLNRETGVQPLVTWDKRVSVTFAAYGLMGVLSILLTREIAARRDPNDDLTYTCSICGVPVPRGRPPQPDEAIYCTEKSCKREQQRLNQAAWRARKRAEGKS